MVKSLGLEQEHINYFSPKSEEKQTNNETRILQNNLKTRSEQEFQKTTSAFIDYPIKGLKGDVNSNFYEFLAMGMIPYLVGSAMFMVVFNCVNKYLKIPALHGKKMALGVVLYGLLKNISKHAVTIPIKAATGVDVELPYENIVYPLPKEAGEAANIEVQHQQRKVYDSKEFFRKDLLDRTYFDRVAQKLGLGTNLNDSISETTPIIQNIVATSNTAKSISSYVWAGVGVAIAAQNNWKDFFDTFTTRKKFLPKQNDSFISKVGDWFKTRGQNIKDLTVSFIKTFGRSCKSLWDGDNVSSKYMKHTGKAFVCLATALTLGLTANSIIRAKSMAKNNNKKRKN